MDFTAAAGRSRSCCCCDLRWYIGGFVVGCDEGLIGRASLLPFAAPTPIRVCPCIFGDSDRGDLDTDVATEETRVSCSLRLIFSIAACKTFSSSEYNRSFP